MRVGVVGVGHLGRLHARVYAEMRDVDLVGVVDTHRERGEEVARKYDVPLYSTPEALVEHVDAVSIVVPTPLHLQAAFPYLEAGKAVLIEKPLAKTLDEADKIIQLAEASGSTLQVGHIERFNPVVEAALPHIGKPVFIECDRIHPFSLRSTEVSVVLDLMIHDIDLVLHFTDDEPEEIDALGTSVLSPTEDLATARILFRKGTTAMVKTSRVAINRSRKIRIFSERAYMSLDLVNKSGMRTYLREGYDPRELTDAEGRINAPEGAEAFLASNLRMEQLVIPTHEPLVRELGSFVRAARGEHEPSVTGYQGRRAMAAARTIQERIRYHQDRIGRS